MLMDLCVQQEEKKGFKDDSYIMLTSWTAGEWWHQLLRWENLWEDHILGKVREGKIKMSILDMLY